MEFLISNIGNWFTKLVPYTFFNRKKIITQEKIEERESMIRIRAVTQSWSALLVILVFASFYNLVGKSFAMLPPVCYLLTALIVYGVSYLLNRRKFS